MPLIASVPSAQRRSFISLLNRNRDSSKPVELEPGWGAILKWVSRINDNVRGQARGSLIRAFNDLFAYKNRYQTPVNSSQANQCYRLIQYIIEDPLNEGGKDLTLEDLVAARQALLRPPKDDPSYHLSFSRFLYHEIQKRRAEQIDGAFGDGLSEFAELMEDEHAQLPTATENPDAHDPLPSTKLSTVHDDDFRCFLLALSQYKAASEASEILKPFWHNLMLKDRVYKGSKSLWIIVMRGLASEGKESELRELVTFAEAAGVQYMPAFHEIMTVFYAQRDMLDETQTWFRKPIYGKWRPTKNTYYEVLKFCTRMQQSRWAKDIFQNLIESNPRKELWDVCFQWAVLFLGKGAQEIKHMFNVMVQNNPNDPVLRPDIDSINSVIRAAVDRYEPLLAERFITLAAELGIRLNAETHILQLEYRLNAEDMSGCKAAYLDMQLVESNADEDVPVVNRYIRALCHTRTQDLEFAKRVVSDLESRSITLEPETVVALSIAFLQQDESRDLADTLSLNVFQFSAGQRESIRGAFVDFILDSANSVERSWHAYMMLHHFFGETSRQDRLRIIEGYFRRRDAEKASQVFEHMRNHFNIDVRPTTDDYVRILELFSVCPSQTGLKRVYALLKMDSNVHPNTKLYNGIMLAFGACGQHSRAIEFWNEIAHSIEGPSYESIEIIFWVCEKMPFGDKTARAIWRNMETMDIEVPIKVFGAYAGAIAGSGVLSDVISLFKSAEASLGYPPDPDSIGIAYNALPGQDLQRSFEFWAKGAFPKQWLHLESYTRDETSQFLQIFRVKRDLRA
ncbi:Complex I intermediate-associated protein 84 [Ceratocystis lukuohia]|uniref:Complex I intermediate-associated protein 84 n=1 Tax=Ceratocystis lukuohia TaxID=2019550 RepID=A0ABR4MMY9_9PEZI